MGRMIAREKAGENGGPLAIVGPDPQLLAYPQPGVPLSSLRTAWFVLAAPIVSACGPSVTSTAASPAARRVDITARDYTFDAPDTLPAGPTVFQLTNRGRMQHEIVIFRPRPGVSAAQLLSAPTPEARRALADPPVGVIFAPVNHPVSSELRANLEAGRWYIMFCGIRDTIDMPPHFQVGMVDSFYVR